MEGLFINLAYVLLFAFFAKKLSCKDYQLLCVRVRKYVFSLSLITLFSSVLFIAPSYADGSEAGDTGLFKELIDKGTDIFVGVRNIVYVVAGFGIIGVAVGGFFGNLNWKWLGAIIIGLVVIGMTTGILQYVSGDSSFSVDKVTDGMK